MPDMTSLQHASCLHITNPLDVHAGLVQRVEVGTMIDTLAPGWDYPTVLLINGEPIAREMWAQPAQAGDVIAFVLVTQGGGGGGSNGGLRTVLMVVATVAINMWAPGAGSVFLDTVLKVAATMAVNAVIASVLPLPDASAANGAAESSPTYTVGMGGNSVRIDSPVAECFGTVKRTPEFVAPAYNLYIDNDQYYHALLMIGRGEYDVLTVRIDDTPIGAFKDLQYQVLRPGVQPSYVASNVVTATEVTGQELLTNVYVGPFVAHKAETEASQIGIDLICPYGLSDASGGAMSATVRIERRLVDDHERPLGPWQTLATETVTASTTTAQRRSYTYPVAVGRYMVRCVRTDVKSDSTSVAHEIQWAGLRAHLANADANLPDCTMLEVKIRATDQLNGMSQRQINAVVTRRLPRWTGSAWTAPEPTRSIAWAAAYIMRDAPSGVTIADDRLDLDALLQLDAVWQSRQDHFDWVCDSSTTAWDALTTCLRAGRAVPMLRGSITTVFRDQPQELPVALWSPRNIKADSLSLSLTVPGEQTPDGVVVEYWSNQAWDWKEVTYPTLSNPVRPQRMRMPGISGASQAKREAAYIYADHLYRTERATWTATRDGLLPAYGSLCLLAHDLPEWGSATGDVVSWNPSTKAMGLTDPPPWGSGAAHYIRVTSPAGDVTPPILCARGADDFTAILASAPGVSLITDDPMRERSRYVIGTAADTGEPVIIRSIRPRRWEEVELEAVIEDARVHTADTQWLPAPGEVQDAPTDGTGVDIDNPAPTPTLTGRSVNVTEISGWDIGAGVQLGTDGQLTYGARYAGRWGGAWGQPYSTIRGEWLDPGPQPPGVSDDYEVRADVVSSGGDAYASIIGDQTGAWLPMTSARVWSAYGSGSGGISGSSWSAVITLSVRLAGTTDVLASCSYALGITFTSAETGGA